MPKKRFGAEQIVTLLRQIEVLMAQGKSAPEACREAGISQQNYAMSRRNRSNNLLVRRYTVPSSAYRTPVKSDLPRGPRAYC